MAWSLSWCLLLCALQRPLVAAEPVTVYTPRQQLLHLVQSPPSAPAGPLPFFGAVPLPRSAPPAPQPPPPPPRRQQQGFAPVGSIHCKILTKKMLCIP